VPLTFPMPLLVDLESKGRKRGEDFGPRLFLSMKTLKGLCVIFEIDGLSSDAIREILFEASPGYYLVQCYTGNLDKTHKRVMAISDLVTPSARIYDNLQIANRKFSEMLTWKNNNVLTKD
jgi:hypothetical protein